MPNFENEKVFLHALSNAVSKVQGKAMMAQLKADKTSPEELREKINQICTSLEEVIQLIADRKKDS